MAPRVTPRTLTAALALVAMTGFAASAVACDGHAKQASAARSCCAARSTTASACTNHAMKTAASATPLAAPAPVAAPFAALPNFAQPAPIVAGLMAFLDPETGLLSGPIGNLQLPDDVARANAAPVDLVPVTLPNGTVILDLQGTLMDNFVLTIDPLGRRSFRCVQDARQALAPAAPLLPAAPVLLPMSDR